MHRIFRNTLFPRIGNFDEVHGSLAEMLLLCEEAMTKEYAPPDISDVMFNELWNCIMNRKVPIYGPYLFAYIRQKWHDTYLIEEFHLQADYFVQILSGSASRTNGPTHALRLSTWTLTQRLLLKEAPLLCPALLLCHLGQ